MTSITEHCQHLLLDKRLSFKALHTAEIVVSASSLLDNSDRGFTEGFEIKLSMDWSCHVYRWIPERWQTRSSPLTQEHI